MCIHCYPDGFQYASVCHKAIAKCFTKRCKGNKIFLNDSSHVTIFALADTNTFHTPKLKQFVYAGMLIRESWVLIEVSCISSLILPMIDTFDG